MSTTTFTRVGSGERIEITGNATVGRLKECALQLMQPHASRQHARITQQDGTVWLEDLGSANGTFVNGARIEGRVMLTTADRVRFDVEEFDVSISGPVIVSAPPVEATRRRPPAEPVEKERNEPREKRPGAWADTQSLRDQRDRTKYIPAAKLEAEIRESLPQRIPGKLPVTTDAAAVASPVGALAATRQPHLLIQRVAGPPSTVTLGPKPDGPREWSVGSRQKCDVFLPSEGVSALHAKIVNDGQRWKVVDEMSANGTFVNGQRTNVSYLSSGDRLRFGPAEGVFQLPDAASDGPGERPAAARGRAWVAALAVLLTAAVLLLVYRLSK